MRTDVSAATLAIVANNATQPVYFVEIVWATFSSKFCTFGTLDWNGSTWLGSGLVVANFDDSGRPTQITISDFDFAIRTLVLTQGIRDRRINLWHGYATTLGALDPVQLPVSYGDACDIAGGKVVINLGGKAGGREFTPRELIGPRIGVNFTAPPGTKIPWGSSFIVLTPRK